MYLFPGNTINPQQESCNFLYFQSTEQYLLFIQKFIVREQNNVKLSLGKVMDSHSEFPAVLTRL